MPILAVLALFAALAYAPELGLPFVGDDYVFLDETANAPFTSLWSLENTAFRRYRPWSREVHFWTVQQLAGLSPLAFRLVGLFLWLLCFLLYLNLLERFLPRGTARLATLGAASMAMWGTPVLWISGSQDLWMLVFGLLFLVLLASRRDSLMPAALALALLSKETAAVLPLVGIWYSITIQRESWKRAAARLLPSLGVAALWFVLHPTLRQRVLQPMPVDQEFGNRPSQLVVAVKNILATVNLSVVPNPTEVGSSDVARALLGAGVLGFGAWLALRKSKPPEETRTSPRKRDVIVFLAGWAVIGWLPTHVPAIGWHAYYGCFGALGVWALIAIFLSERRALAISILAALALFRAADAKTLTWDWGNEWYLRRAGSLLAAIEHKLKELHPTLPPSTRLFLGRLPNNIGLVAGRSAAVRIWYRDTTLTADFYSNYRPRSRPGQDLFFRFDTLQVLTEVVSGPSVDAHERAVNPEWGEDHVKLAMLFLGAGEPARAADEFEKVWRLENRPQEALYAAASRRLAGQPDRAESILQTFTLQTGVSLDSARSFASELARSAPGPR
jgi:hypothetical protein